jgi:hypothetical protein
MAPGRFALGRLAMAEAMTPADYGARRWGDASALSLARRSPSKWSTVPNDHRRSMGRHVADYATVCGWLWRMLPVPRRRVIQDPFDLAPDRRCRFLVQSTDLRTSRSPSFQNQVDGFLEAGGSWA